MSQIEIWHGLEREVRAAGNVCVFNQAKATSAALANYAAVENVMRALRGQTRTSMDERQLLIDAILRQQQAAPHALWTAMLALTFRPMLARLARKLTDVAPEEREQTALFAFIETLAKVTPGKGSTVFSLYWAVRRRVIRPLRRARLKAAQTIVFAEEKFCPTSPSMEVLIDEGRFARLMAASPPKPRETTGTYVARITGTRNYEKRERLRRALSYSRVGDLTDIREHFLKAMNS